MASQNKFASGLLGTISLFALAACGSTGMGGPSGSGTIYRAPNNIQAAICEGRANEAVSVLTAEPLQSPTDRFFTAVALEESGMAIQARQMFATLMSQGFGERVYMRCGNRTLASGTIMDEAGRHLGLIARDLQALDVAMAPSHHLHEGLPAQSTPVQNTATTKSAARHRAAAVIDVSRPGSQSPLGRWFAHLASYRSVENAEENKGQLAKQFPNLANVLDQWEVDVKGFAIRLGVRVRDKDDATELCNAIKREGAYCAVLDTNG